MDDQNEVTDYTLNQNYPNPFNPATIISFSLPHSEFVTLKVYDILGSEIATLINDYRDSGNYKLTFNPTGLSSGIYFYKLQAGDFTGTKKMIYLR